MTDKFPSEEINEVIDKLDIKDRYRLKDLLLPGIRMKLREMSVDDVVSFYEPHVVNRSGPDWQ